MSEAVRPRRFFLLVAAALVAAAATLVTLGCGLNAQTDSQQLVPISDITFERSSMSMSLDSNLGVASGAGPQTYTFATLTEAQVAAGVASQAEALWYKPVTTGADAVHVILQTPVDTTSEEEHHLPVLRSHDASTGEVCWTSEDTSTPRCLTISSAVMAEQVVRVLSVVTPAAGVSGIPDNRVLLVVDGAATTPQVRFEISLVPFP